MRFIWGRDGGTRECSLLKSVFSPGLDCPLVAQNQNLEASTIWKEKGTILRNARAELSPRFCLPKRRRSLCIWPDFLCFLPEPVNSTWILLWLGGNLTTFHCSSFLALFPPCLLSFNSQFNERRTCVVWIFKVHNELQNFLESFHILTHKKFQLEY